MVNFCDTWGIFVLNRADHYPEFRRYTFSCPWLFDVRLHIPRIEAVTFRFASCFRDPTCVFSRRRLYSTRCTDAYASVITPKELGGEHPRIAVIPWTGRQADVGKSLTRNVIFSLAQAVGYTSNKWANKELWMKAANEEHEFLDWLGASGPPSSSLPQDVEALQSSPPWIKELPPVRDLRKQLASGKVLPFLDQHDYSEPRTAERKRTAHGRKKRAFVSTAKAVPKISPAQAVVPPDTNRVRHHGERPVAAYGGFGTGKVQRLDATEKKKCPGRDPMIGYISPKSGDTMSSGANNDGEGSPSHESIDDRNGARPAKACHAGAETSRRGSRARRYGAGSRGTSAAANGSVSGSGGESERVEPAENSCGIPVRPCDGYDRTNEHDSSEQRLGNDGEGVKTDDALIEDVGSLSSEVGHPTRGKDSGSGAFSSSVGNPAAVVTSSVRVTEIRMLPH